MLLCFCICQFHSFGRQSVIIDSLKKELKKVKQDSTKVKILNDIGGYLSNAREDNEALNYLFEGYELSEKTEYWKGTCISLNRIGTIYSNQNNYAKALEYFNKALVLSRKLKDKKNEADVISNMGIIYCEQGLYAKALENYMNALKTREALKETRGTAGSMMSIANIYYLQAKYPDALNFYLNVLKVKGIKEDKYFYAQAMFNTALAFLQLKNYTQTLAYLNNALKIDVEIGDKQGIALIYVTIGNVYSQQKNYGQALKVSLDGLTILTELNDKKNIAEICGELGIICDSLKDYEKAEIYYKRQFLFSKEIGNKLNIGNAYQHLANHFQLLNNYKEAFNYLSLYKNVEDTLKNESGLKALTELETRYETQNKEKEIKLLKAEQELQNAENTKQKQLIIGCVILATVLLLTLFLLYNRQQIKRKSILEKKNFELERNALSAQMNPHFIFNSLGSISGFISENDKEKAMEYLGIFSRLIRHNLEQSREQLVSVVQEAKMLKSYLFLQQLRYNHKFNFIVDMDENMDSSIAIPPMFIQPFVENAILHGIIPKNENGNILVKFYLKADEVICEVHDDGIGKTESLNRKSDNNTHKSLAMTITEERMQIINSMNKEKISIVMDDMANTTKQITGTLVKLIFPKDYI